MSRPRPRPVVFESSRTRPKRPFQGQGQGNDCLSLSSSWVQSLSLRLTVTAPNSSWLPSDCQTWTVIPSRVPVWSLQAGVGHYGTSCLVAVVNKYNCIQLLHRILRVLKMIHFIGKVWWPSQGFIFSICLWKRKVTCFSRTSSIIIKHFKFGTSSSWWVILALSSFTSSFCSSFLIVDFNCVNDMIPAWNIFSSKSIGMNVSSFVKIYTGTAMKLETNHNFKHLKNEQYTPWAIKKRATFIFTISLANVDRFQ